MATDVGSLTWDQVEAAMVAVGAAFRLDSKEAKCIALLKGEKVALNLALMHPDQTKTLAYKIVPACMPQMFVCAPAGFKGMTPAIWRDTVMNALKATHPDFIWNIVPAKRAAVESNTSVMYNTDNGYTSSGFLKIFKQLETMLDKTNAPQPLRSEAELVWVNQMAKYWIEVNEKAKYGIKLQKESRSQSSMSHRANMTFEQFKLETPVERVSVAAPVPKRKARRVDEDTTLWDPPKATVQQLRTAAVCMPLRKYLKNRGVMKRTGKSHWQAIKNWCATPDGVMWMKDADLDPLSFDLHHVISKEHGGHLCIYNCVFAPSKANSSWGSTDSKVMRAYVGEIACKIADHFGQWAARDGIELSNYSYESALMS